MYLKDDKIIATIMSGDGKDSIVMRSYRTGLSREFILNPTAVTGWLDGTNVRRPNTPRLTKHGDFFEKATLGARLISFSGTAVASSISNLQRMRDEFVGILSDGSYGSLTVETNSGTRYASVGLEGSTSWVLQGDTVAVWKIDLYAPDPHVYGPPNNVQTGIVTAVKGGLGYRLDYPLDYNLQAQQIVDTTQTIKNNGNAPSWPVFRVVGDFYGGFELNDNDGHIVRYTGIVTKSSPVIIDMALGTAIQNEVDQTALINRRQWFSIPPGGTLQPEFNPLISNDQNGTGWCDILYKDTWI